jgi:ribosome maturation factor RimP
MTDVLEKIRSLLEPLLEGTDIFVVNMKIKPINNIKIFLDADGGLSIEKSATVNRKLYHLMEAEQMFPDGDFSLEVSSPGVDEPLMGTRQYKKNIGRKVAVTSNEDIEQTGILKEVKEDSLVLEMQNKKKEITIVEIPFSQIKKTVVQIIF